MPVQALNGSTREAIYRRTLAAVMAEIGDPDDPSQLIGRCLDIAWHGYRLIKDWPCAPRTILQAGSCQWPRVAPELDDGRSPTHFAYMWDGDSPIAHLVRSGIIPVIQRTDGHVAPSLPEVHVWLGCPETGEIIDFTTGLWPLACKATLGLDWPGTQPPPFFWNFGTRLPADVRYVASREAIECVVAILRQQGNRYP